MAKRKLPRDPELLELSKTLTCREIAQRYDVNLHYAYQMLRRLWADQPTERPLGKRKVPSDRTLLELRKTMTARQIASRYGVHFTAVHKHLRRLRQPPDAEELADAIQRWGLDGAAEEYDVDVAQVAAWMRELDL